jgi:hypothetical protein
MSRARLRSTAYVIADDLGQAKEHLQRAWADQLVGPEATSLDTQIAATTARAERLAADQDARRAASGRDELTDLRNRLSAQLRRPTPERGPGRGVGLGR